MQCGSSEMSFKLSGPGVAVWHQADTSWAVEECRLSEFFEFFEGLKLHLEGWMDRHYLRSTTYYPAVAGAAARTCLPSILST